MKARLFALMLFAVMIAMLIAYHRAPIGGAGWGYL
jgi:multisubunit Na+/H+ antiporter MnhB subunit